MQVSGNQETQAAHTEVPGTQTGTSHHTQFTLSVPSPKRDSEFDWSH